MELMLKNNQIYNDMFLQNKNNRTEYGNIESSFAYFQRFNIPKTSIILDIGTNIGSFPNKLFENGYNNIYGVDIAKSAIEFGKKKNINIAERINIFDGKEIPFPNDCFDAVTMFDVIEHIPSTEEFLLEVNRVLKKDGILIFQTPNKFINIPWETIISLSFKWRVWHCSLQTFWSLKKLFKKSNFINVIIEKYNIDTEYNRNKIKKVMGNFGILLIKIFAIFPLFFYPNFWGWTQKLK